MVFLSTRALSFCFLICALLCSGALSKSGTFFFCLQSVRYGARVTPDGSRENGADFKIWEGGGRWTSAFSGEPIDDWAPALWGWASDYIGRLRVQLGEELFPLFD
uniref:Putative secreted protein n=1 Tax=Ixodes ricinus TaxID=34613 RepID=A0A6B0U8J6_IXORI